MKKEYFVFGFLLLISSLIIAQVPQQINYQGMLSDISGNPITGTYTINFSIYNDATTTTSIWTETQSVTVNNGLFSVQLGFNNPIPIYIIDGTIKYLGVQVGTDPEMTPRQKLTSVGYSFKAANAVTLNGLPSSSFADASHDHNSVYYTKTEVNTDDGTPNQTEDPVSWSKIKDIPAGFADGTDDGGSTTHNHFGENWSNTNSTYGLNIQNTGTGNGLEGSSGSNTGLMGTSAGTGGNAIGVKGVSPNGYGLYGEGGTGIYASGNAAGVYAISNDGYGLMGASGSSIGVDGSSSSNVGVHGSSLGSGENAKGIFGEAAGGYGVHGSGSTGVYGTGPTAGVSGESTSGYGVYGSSSSTEGVSGSSFGSGETAKGVHGVATNGYGVYGNGIVGVHGTGTNAGVTGESSSGAGVFGVSTSGTGVRGSSSGQFENGVYGYGYYGVYGFCPISGYAVYGYNPGHMAGEFNGNVNIMGTLWKSGGAFRIDHPLDPANKYLQHSFVESPDMKNIYDGTVILNSQGEATITLPNWFEALNKNFRYQLTCIGGYAQVYIAEEITNNHFKIAGGTPNLKISWMVTGIRKDAYAVAHPIEVEVDKPITERGKYIYPELFGASEEAGINYEQHKKMEEMNKQNELNKMIQDK